MNIAIGIPCYNCEKQIPRVLKSIEDHFDKSIDIYIVDNGSTDNTINNIKQAASGMKRHNVSLFLNQSNFGLGGSHKVVFNLAIEKNYDAILICHGDDQASIIDSSIMIDEFFEEKNSILGSRFMKGSHLYGYQKSRIYGNKALNILFSFVLRRRIVDLGSGLNLFSVSDLKKIDLNSLSDHFNFNVDLLLSFVKNSLDFTFVPISWKETDQISNAKNISVAWSMLISLIRFCFGLYNRDFRKSYPSDLIYSNR